MEAELFPCPLEQTVASALLLLSTTPPPSSLSPPKAISKDECSFKEEIEEKCYRESMLLGDSKSSCSSMTSECSSQKIRAPRVSTIGLVARSNEMELKVVRKSRSKLYWISDCPKTTPDEEFTTTSDSASMETSCLSSSSSDVSSAKSRCAVTRAKKKLAMIREERRMKHVGSAHMRRRAEAILNFLSGGSSSEVKIRQVIGDSPDTSKALRMLLKLEEIIRSGGGGRHDPFIYTIA